MAGQLEMRNTKTKLWQHLQDTVLFRTGTTANMGFAARLADGSKLVLFVR